MQQYLYHCSWNIDLNVSTSKCVSFKNLHVGGHVAVLDLSLKGPDMLANHKCTPSTATSRSSHAFPHCMRGKKTLRQYPFFWPCVFLCNNQTMTTAWLLQSRSTFLSERIKGRIDIDTLCSLATFSGLAHHVLIAR